MSLVSSFRRSSVFDITTYTIEFESIFIHSDLEEAFFIFLKSEFNTEPFECIKRIDALKKIDSNKEKLEKTLKFIEEFIQEGSDKEVNISKETKQELFKNIESQLSNKEWNMIQTPYEVLLPLRNVLKNQLNADNFPRFIRSPKHNAVFQKYVDDIKVMKTYTALRYPFTDEYFETPFVAKDEEKFLHEIFKDSFTWDVVYSKNHFNMYHSKTNFLPRLSSFENPISMKYQIMLPFSFERVVSFYLSKDYLNSIAPGIVDLVVDKKINFEELIKEYPDQEINPNLQSFIGSTYYVYPFPMKPRKSIDIYTTSFNMEDKSLTFLRRPYNGDFKGKNLNLKKKIKFENFLMNSETRNTKTVEGYLGMSMLMIKFDQIDKFTTKLSYVTSKKNFCSNQFSICSTRCCFTKID
jgi:hypothetical protein